MTADTSVFVTPEVDWVGTYSMYMLLPMYHCSIESKTTNG